MPYKLVKVAVRRRRRPMRGKGLGDFISNTAGGIGQGAHNLLTGLFGFGRKRRVKRRRPMRGRGLGDIISGTNKILTDTGILSKIATALGHPNLGNAVANAGYGRKKRKRGRGINRTAVMSSAKLFGPQF